MSDKVSLAEWRWQLRLLFTPETHAEVYCQPFYVALRHLARLMALGLPLTYQVAVYRVREQP